MELMKKLFHGKGYIDGITIINLEGEILFTAKLNNKLSSQEEPYELVGQKFLDVYENLDPKTSTTIKAMELGLPVYIENQLLKAQQGGNPDHLPVHPYQERKTDCGSH